MKTTLRSITFRCVERYAVMIGVAFVWYGVSDLGVAPRAFLPSPRDVFLSLSNLLQSGDLLPMIATTGRRMSVGWISATVVGVAVGAAIASSPRAERWLSPSLEFLRPLPASAVIPAFIMAFGLSEAMIEAVIIFGAVWPVLLNTLSGLRAVDRRQIEVATALELDHWSVFTKIKFPAAIPDIIAGLRLALALALVLCIVTEMVTLNGGIGEQILMASRSFQSADLFAGVVLIGCIGFFLNLFIGQVENRLLVWRK